MFFMIAMTIIGKKITAAKKRKWELNVIYDCHYNYGKENCGSGKRKMRVECSLWLPWQLWERKSWQWKKKIRGKCSLWLKGTPRKRNHGSKKKEIESWIFFMIAMTIIGKKIMAVEKENERQMIERNFKAKKSRQRKKENESWMFFMIAMTIMWKKITAAKKIKWELNVLYDCHDNYGKENHGSKKKKMIERNFKGKKVKTKMRIECSLWLPDVLWNDPANPFHLGTLSFIKSFISSSFSS